MLKYLFWGLRVLGFLLKHFCLNTFLGDLAPLRGTVTKQAGWRFRKLVPSLHGSYRGTYSPALKLQPSNPATRNLRTPNPKP